MAREYNCFTCGETVYFHRDVKRKDRPDKLQALQEPYDESDQFPVIHECRGGKKPAYDYQGQGQQQQTQLLPERNQQNTSSQTKIPILQKKDLEPIEAKLDTLTKLMEATIKGIDGILKKEGKESLLFNQASTLQQQQQQPQQEKSKVEDVEDLRGTYTDIAIEES